MLFPLLTLQANLCFYADAAVSGDRREELVRIRLSKEDLDKATAIQDYLDSVGQHASLGAVMSNALDAYFSILVAEGALTPSSQ